MKQTRMNCLQSNCPKRPHCAIAQKQVEGNRTVHVGYVDGKCNEYKLLEHWTRKTIDTGTGNFKADGK